jgi:predicted GTPase
MESVMGEGKGEGMPPMAKMMEQMMPHGLGVILPQMPKENRVEFSIKMIKSLLDNGTNGMTAEEKKAYMQRIIEVIH